MPLLNPLFGLLRCERTPVRIDDPPSHLRRGLRSMHPLGQNQTSQEADPRLLVRRLPAHLAALISPEVLADREAAITRRLEDGAGDRIRRRRAAEVLAHHLLENVA